MRTTMLLLLLVAMLLVACGPTYTASTDDTGNDDTGEDCTEVASSLYRCIDTDASVVCWYALWGGRPAISCLPIGQTSLDINYNMP